MTDLLTRTAPRSPTTTSTRRLLPPAVYAGAGAAAAGLLACMAVAVAGWFSADAGAHGQTTDALRIGTDAWLMGHGSHLVAGGLPVGIVPLALTVLAALLCFRFGRWAGASVGAVDNRAVALAVGAGAAGYGAVVVVAGLLARHPDAQLDLPRAVVGGVLLWAVAGGPGLAAGTGRWTVWRDGVPGWLRSIVAGGLTGAVLVVLAGAVLVVVSLLLSLGDAATVVSSLHLGLGDALMYLVVTLAVAPNAALLGAAYLVGPGFAVGTGTVVSTTAVTLGPMPAFPLLAALPADGTPAGWLAGLMAVPPLAAAVAAGWAQRRYAVTAWDSAALRGFAVGAGSAVMLWLLVSVAGGALGTGRMADIGAPSGEVLVTALGGMSIGGLLGGLVVTFWQRHLEHAHRDQ